MNRVATAVFRQATTVIITVLPDVPEILARCRIASTISGLTERVVLVPTTIRVIQTGLPVVNVQTATISVPEPAI